MSKQREKRTPLPSAEPMKVAQMVTAECFTAEDGLPTVLWFRGSFWEYFRNRWERRDVDWMDDRLFQELEDAVYMVQRGKHVVAERFAPDVMKVANVRRALRALPEVRRDYKNIPVWLKGYGDLPSPEALIGFEDVLVPVVPGPGILIPRGPSWFDPCVLPVPYDPAAKCPTWHRCLLQWGSGSQEWITLLKRWFGYCLMNHRRYAKWLLMKGKTRAGKGTIAKVLMQLVGDEGFQGVVAERMVSTFSLQGFETTRVMSITEMDCTDKKVVQAVSSFIKRLVGQDPQTINIKFQAPLKNVVIPAAPMVQANMIPHLPDIGGGVSSKMLVLPFHWSAMDPGETMDPRLDEKLKAELTGIAAWAVEGARELELGLGFPVLDQAAEEVEAYRMANSPMDGFLEDHFERDKDGFVATEILWALWERWRRENQSQVHYPRNLLRTAILEGSSWSLTACRPNKGPRGIRGLALRPGVVL